MLAGETSDIILANAKRVIRDAWVLSGARRRPRSPSVSEERTSAVHRQAAE